MGKRLEFTIGQRVGNGHWVVLGEGLKTKSNVRRIRLICEHCNWVRLVYPSKIKTGRLNPCKCKEIEGFTERKKIKVEPGKTFGRWTILSPAEPKGKRRRSFWKCECLCGVIKEVSQISLRRGASKSCGCLRIDNLSETLTKHGMSFTKEYQAWRDMKDRCKNPNNKHYKHYGGRNIQVCQRWAENFQNFYNDLGEKPEGTSLDRLDPDGNYEPGNVMWRSFKKQTDNRRGFLQIKRSKLKKLLKSYQNQIQDLKSENSTLESKDQIQVLDRFLFLEKQNKSKDKVIEKSKDLIKRENNEQISMSKTKIYKIWASMKSRCNNPKDTAYDRYGGRGIMSSSNVGMAFI